MKLFPPLALIEEKLFGLQSVEREPRPEHGDDFAAVALAATPSTQSTVHPMDEPAKPGFRPVSELPPGLREMIDRDAASTALPAAPAAVCDIRLVRSVIDAHGALVRNLVSPAAVLLDHANSDGSWGAWVVSSETGYATDHDVIIDHHDAPTDSRASVVQLWNRINVRLEREAVLLGRMTLERMTLIRILAAGGGGLRAAAVNIPPGRIGAVTLATGETLVTGGPITTLDDERHDLKDLYRRFGNELNTHAAHAHRIDTDAVPVMTGSSAPGPMIVTLTVTLADGATLAAVLALLRAIDGTILPADVGSGAISVGLGSIALADARSALAESPLVRRVSQDQ